MYKIADKVIKFITEAMEDWKVELTTGGKSLADPERHLPGRCAVAITINSKIPLHILEVNWRLQIY